MLKFINALLLFLSHLISGILALYFFAKITIENINPFLFLGYGLLLSLILVSLLWHSYKFIEFIKNTLKK